MYRPAVEIDLNDRDPQGRTIVFQSDASAPLIPGMIVTAFESEEGVVANAMVASINTIRGTAYIWVDWKSLRRGLPEDAHLQSSPHVYETAARAVAPVYRFAALGLGRHSYNSSTVGGKGVSNA
jgi:hypothetical protein